MQPLTSFSILSILEGLWVCPSGTKLIKVYPLTTYNLSISPFISSCVIVVSTPIPLYLTWYSTPSIKLSKTITPSLGSLSLVSLSCTSL